MMIPANESILIEGAGGHGKVVIDCLQTEKRKIIAVFDPKRTGNLLGIPIRSAYDPHFEPEALFIAAIGSNEIRKQVVVRVRHRFTNTIHPSAMLATEVKIGTGCMIFHRSIVQTGSTIGNHVILNTGSQVDHDGRIGDFVHLGPRSVLCGNVSVGEGTLIGAGAVVLPGITIGNWAVIGAGAVVTRNVADHIRVAGVPAKILK